MDQTEDWMWNKCIFHSYNMSRFLFLKEIREQKSGNIDSILVNNQIWQRNSFKKSNNWLIIVKKIIFFFTLWALCLNVFTLALKPMSNHRVCIFKWRVGVCECVCVCEFVCETFLIMSLASTVMYGGRLTLHFRILSMVFFLFSAVNGG